VEQREKSNMIKWKKIVAIVMRGLWRIGEKPQSVSEILVVSLVCLLIGSTIFNICGAFTSNNRYIKGVYHCFFPIHEDIRGELVKYDDCRFIKNILKEEYLAKRQKFYCNDDVCVHVVMDRHLFGAETCSKALVYRLPQGHDSDKAKQDNVYEKFKSFQKLSEGRKKIVLPPRRYQRIQ